MSTHGRLRLIPVVAVAWTTAFATTMVPDAAPAVACSLWLLACATLVVAAYRPARRMRLVVAVLAFSLAAGGAVASHVAFAQPVR
ncbi:MAG: competence protein ComEC, partial [Microbacterium sp.]